MSNKKCLATSLDIHVSAAPGELYSRLGGRCAYIESAPEQRRCVMPITILIN